MRPESPSLSTSCNVAHFPLMHSVCEDCYRFALDFGVYKKKKSDPQWAQLEPNIYIQIMQKRYETQDNMYM